MICCILSPSVEKPKESLQGQYIRRIYMKKIGLRQLAVILISAFMNRAVLLMMNPFGIAYFAAAYLQKPGRLLLTLVSLLGMSLIMPGTVLLKYTVVILCKMCIRDSH